MQLTYRINQEKVTHVFKLDVQNAINRENPWWDYYNPERDQVETDFQVGVLPILTYKLQF